MESSNKIKTINNLSDSPITDESQDCLRRIPFIISLYEEISDIPFEDSFCFGLYGGWGEGKTSVLNLLKKKIKQNKNIILFEFDPWYISSKEAILKNFLEGFESKLTPISKNKRIFKKYFRRLSSVGVSVLGAGFQVGWESGKPDFSELKEEINSLIKKSNKRMIILIDDVDRLQPEEILQVFKLVKLIADFKHTVFVLSMDVEAVKRALKSHEIGIEYIDKIVQKPVPLPKIEQNDIDKFLWEEIEDLFKKLNLENQRVSEVLNNFSFIYQKNIKNLFTTLRGVKRYVNSLLSSIPPIVDEVHLLDFTILEIIKVFAPFLYDDIYENWWFYVDERSNAERDFNPLLWQNIDDDQEKLKIIREHVEQLLCNQFLKEVFINLLGVLFPIINDVFKLYNQFSKGKIARQERRIYSTSFSKYFTLRVPGQELPDALVNQIVSSWNRTPPEKLTESITETFNRFKQQDKLAELFTKLNLLENNITPEITRSLIRSIYKNSSIFSKNSTGSWLDSEFYKADSLIVDLLRDKMEKTEVLAILEEIMLHTNNLDFASGVYINCTQEQNRYPNEKWDILPNVRKALVDRFKKDFIEINADFFKTGEPCYILVIFWNLCAEEEKVDPKVCTCAKYVSNMLDRNSKYIGKILNCFVQRWVSTDTRGTSLDVYEVAKYLDIDALHEKIIKEKEDIDTTDEEKRSVELFMREYKSQKTLTKNTTKQEII